MKKTLILACLLAFAGLVQAETSVTLKGVHNCCAGCANGITKAVTSIKDVTASTNGRSVTLTGRSKAQIKKAIEALLDAGYYGKQEDEESASVPAGPKAAARAAKKWTAATVTGAHLCCDSCVDAVSDAVKTVPGITKSNIEAKQNTFTVEGEFSEGDLVAALNKAGFHGKVGK